MWHHEPNPVTDEEPAPALRAVAIMEKSQILEIWHIQHLRTVYKERDLELPKILRTRTINGQRQRYNVYRRQVAHQEWGHFVIRRYQATRLVPWMPSLSMGMLIPGTLLAAGTASNGIMHVPLGLLMLQSILVSVGGVLAVASGWRILRRLRPGGVIELESLGVSGHALGFPTGVVALDVVPNGFRTGRFKGAIEVEGSTGEWKVVAEHEADGEYHDPRKRF
jgi:membrane protein implicated in regulation of membrane protease activity